MADREKRMATAVATNLSLAAAVEPAQPQSSSDRRQKAHQMNILSLTYKKYPGQEQVDMSVKIDVPGNWFSASSMGGLTSAEKKEKYVAVCVEYEALHVFEPEDKKKKQPAKLGEAVRGAATRARRGA